MDESNVWCGAGTMRGWWCQPCNGKHWRRAVLRRKGTKVQAGCEFMQVFPGHIPHPRAHGTEQAPKEEDSAGVLKEVPSGIGYGRQMHKQVGALRVPGSGPSEAQRRGRSAWVRPGATGKHGFRGVGVQGRHASSFGGGARLAWR